jgi:hypothetical protein
MAETQIYSAVFLVDPMIVEDDARWKLSKFHVTYHYNPGNPLFPDGVHTGDWCGIKHRGIYDDGEILASQVSLRVGGIDISFQRGADTLLHITWDSGELPPMEAGVRLNDAALYEDHYHSFNDINEYYHSFGEDAVRRLKYAQIMQRMNTVGMWNCFKN